MLVPCFTITTYVSKLTGALMLQRVDIHELSNTKETYEADNNLMH